MAAPTFAECSDLSARTFIPPRSFACVSFASVSFASVALSIAGVQLSDARGRAYTTGPRPGNKSDENECVVTKMTRLSSWGAPWSHDGRLQRTLISRFHSSGEKSSSSLHFFSVCGRSWPCVTSPRALIPPPPPSGQVSVATSVATCFCPALPVKHRF